jgi:hypothetical protein
MKVVHIQVCECASVCTYNTNALLRLGDVLKIRSSFILRMWAAGAADARGRWDVEGWRITLSSL